jgi:peptidoglycan/LPS O-acetylase OafA/YrhL
MVTVRSSSTSTLRAASGPEAGPSRLSGLDGLRAVAVIGVLIFHAGVTHLPGGFLGVDLFFVISGFLITWLLIAERQRHGRISLGRFYLRRARRLLPALATMVAATTVFMALFFRDDLAEARGDIGAAAGYFSNWWYVLHHRSYFVAAGRQPPLQHLWSLAVEEQFYLLWPLLLIILLVVRVRLRWVFAVATVGALASAWWMRTLAIRGNVPFDTDSARLYFGTDTHASALLVGAAGAAVMAGLARRRARTGRDVSPITTLLADLAGLAALVGVVWMMHSRTSVSPELFRRGFLVFAVIALVVVVTASLPGSLLGALLDIPPLRWVGTRSYGLYLWHWPVFVYTRPGLDWQLFGWKAFAVRIGVTVALTELTYQLVEKPIRERGFAAYLRGGPRWRPRWLAAPSWGVAAPALAATGLVLAVGGTALATHYRAGGTTRHTASDVVAQPSPPSPPPSPGVPATESSAAATPSVTPSTSATPVSHSQPAPTHTRAVKPPPKQPPPAGTESSVPPPIPAGPPPPLTAVGDSVLIDGEVTLKQDCPGTEVYAVVGWQAKSVFGQIDALRKAHHLGDIVVIGTGTNGVVSGKELDAVLTSLADRSKVVVVNNHMDRDWEAPNNAMFPQVVKAHPNAVLVDWNAAANKHAEWFEPDGVHLKPIGRQPYADLIRDAAGC